MSRRASANVIRTARCAHRSAARFRHRRGPRDRLRRQPPRGVRRLPAAMGCGSTARQSRHGGTSRVGIRGAGYSMDRRHGSMARACSLFAARLIAPSRRARSSAGTQPSRTASCPEPLFPRPRTRLTSSDHAHGFTASAAVETVSSDDSPPAAEAETQNHSPPRAAQAAEADGAPAAAQPESAGEPPA